MATFTSFLDVLPTPSKPIGAAGQSLATGSGGVEGPGFASVQFSSVQPVQVSRTNSGRVITRTAAGHKWDINITYNPMTRDQFEPVYSFLLEKNGRLNPFFVQLPQHLTSRNSAFHTHQGSNNITTANASSAGAGFLLTAGHSTTQTTEPQPGDLFTISDSNDSLHTKAYRVTRVMNNSTYNSSIHSQPTTSQRIIYFTPNLQRSVAQSAQLDFGGPTIRVILRSDVQQYALGVDNLFQFSLQLEEAQA
tara:strand:+ start:652 stop:1398 length:747 start_codon:yes stop_codon:yes gene_type:complete